VEDGQNLTWEEGIREFVDQTGLPGPGAWEGGGFPGDRADYPVSGVSWYEAAAYAEWAGKSLPTDIHWQIARGAFTPIVSSPQFGGAALIAPFSNFNSAGPVAVGSLPSLTSFGNYDLAGNVREWCWNETAGGARVIRGGAWDDNPYMFGNRSGVPPMDRSVQNGFRLALYPHPETMPDAVYQPQAFPQARDFYAEQPVSDAVFQAYRDRFSYDPTPLNAEVESRGESPKGWIRERVSFDAAYGGERITGYLHLPRNAEPPYSAVVYFPGSQALGAGDREHLEDWPEFNTFVSFLPAAGRAVLYPAYKGTFDRFDPAVPPMHMGNGTRAYADFQVQVIQDFMRSVDYLESREDVDADRLAYYGMSWGGVLGFIIPAVEDRIATAVLLSGGMLPDPNRKPRPEADPRNYLERIRTPVLMMNGRYDNVLGLEQGIRPAFDLLGTPDADKRLLLYDTDHIPPRTEYIKETLAWLDKYLGPVRR
jgi:dipeptidyl aminopeptidase/acylaminoacyl peptidase